MSQRKAWTVMEDNALKELYEVKGIKRWADISRMLEKDYNIMNRSGKQCRERYHNHLDSSIKHDKWTQQEEDQLLKLHNNLGNHWAEISRSIQGRSQNCVKNQFYSVLRRGLRKINKIIRDKLKRYKELEIGLLYKIVENCDPEETSPLSKNQMTAMDLKREISFFGMSNQDQDEIDLSRIKRIIENVKTVTKTGQKKKGKKSEFSPPEEKESEIESEEYRDNCRPLEDVKLRRSSFYSFRLENQDKNDVEIDPKMFGLPPNPPQFFKTSSLQSVESLSPRLDVASPKCFDLFGLDGGFEFPDNRPSPQAALTCDSPYFDHFKSNYSSWSAFYQQQK